MGSATRREETYRRLEGDTEAHDLRVRDIVIFKGEMVFHVSPFSPSCCDIQYTRPHHQNITGTVATSSYSWDYCFMAEVTATNVQEDKLNLPVEAMGCNALNKQCKKAIVVNKEGKMWTVSLRFSEPGGFYYIRGGWRKFCADNGCRIGDLFVFNVVGAGKTSPLMCMCPERKECWEILSSWQSRKRGETAGDIASSSQVK